MSILEIVFLILGGFAFLFFFWQRLKEDYSSQEIFTAAFLILLGTITGPLAVKFIPFLPQQYWFWAGFLGFLIGFLISVWRLKLKFFETLEAAGMGMLFWLALIFLADAVVNSSLFSLVGFGLFLLLIFLFFFLETRYRNLSWYRSGKIGFSGLTCLGFFFLARSLIAIFFDFVISFTGKGEPILSAVVGFLFFLAVFNLAKQKP